MHVCQILIIMIFINGVTKPELQLYLITQIATCMCTGISTYYLNENNTFQQQTKFKVIAETFTLIIDTNNNT